DLDETLLHATPVPFAQPADFRVGDYFAYRRPFLADFLAAVSDWYDLAVWTSSSAGYAHCVVAQLFAGPDALRFVWARERCTPRYHPELLDYYWIKNLDKLKRKGYRLDRVLVVDDSPEKLSRHYGNLVRVQPFEGDPDDVELRELLPFLDWLRG